MTKYILQSGGMKKNKEQAIKYFSELLKGYGENPRLLWCFFATLPDDTSIRFEKYIKFYEPLLPVGVRPTHENAEVISFEEQVRRADAIYLHGGEIAAIYPILKQYNIDELFDGKTVGTNSASSMVLAKSAWSADIREIKECLGALPIKFIAHYKSDFGSDDPQGLIDWEAAYKELKEYGDTTLPVYALKEGEFEIFEK